MKKSDRRSRQASVIDTSSSQSSVVDDKEHYEERFGELESENKSLKREIEELRYKLASVSSTPIVVNPKLKVAHPRSISVLEKQVSDVKKKLEVQTQRNFNYDKAGTQIKDEIQRLKAQKVQLQCKLKLESVQFRLCKASLQKEINQLKKEQRRNEFEMHLLLAMNQRQKLVLQRKTKEAHVATERLKELLGVRKDLVYRKTGGKNGSSQYQVQNIERELDVTTQVQEVCAEYESQMEEMAEVLEKLKLEGDVLKEENSWCVSLGNVVDPTVKDSEFKDLKEELARLNSLVSQMAVTKAEVGHWDKSQADVVQSSSGSICTGINLSGINTSESENSGSFKTAEQKFESGVCCSCSKNSLCKTSKCRCRASKGSCGTSCGCAASKCSNRKVVSTKMEGSSQSLKSELSMHCAEVPETEMNNASQGYIPDQKSLPDKPHEEKEDFGPTKQPLKDIGNIQINSISQKPGCGKKGKKPATQTGNTIPRKSARNVVKGL